MCAAAKGVVHSSADPWRRPTRARCQKMAEDERSVNSPVRPRPQGGSWSRFDRTKRALLLGRRPNAVVAYGGRARLGFDTASKDGSRKFTPFALWVVNTIGL